MAFTDYTDLRVAVAEQVGRSDIADVMDRLTRLAEARMSQRLRTRRQVKRRLIVSALGRAKLPDDFLEVVKLDDVQGAEVIGQTLHSDGPGFAVEDGHALLADGRYDLHYYARLPSLTDSGTNWILRDYPGAYLYAVAAEASKYLRQPDEASAYAGLMEDEMRQIERNDARARYARARVRVEGPTP